jgi:hypothetical protein
MLLLHLRDSDSKEKKRLSISLLARGTYYLYLIKKDRQIDRLSVLPAVTRQLKSVKRGQEPSSDSSTLTRDMVPLFEVPFCLYLVTLSCLLEQSHVTP